MIVAVGSDAASVAAATPPPASPNGQDDDVVVTATSPGSVNASVKAGQVVDGAAHPNAASTSTSNSVTVTA